MESPGMPRKKPVSMSSHLVLTLAAMNTANVPHAKVSMSEI